MTQIKRISFTVEKKGRKYFSGKVEGYKAQLVINAVSAGFVPGQTVELDVVDISKRSSYGTKLVFQPATDEDRAAVEAANRLEKAARWMSYAERDAKYDRYMQSNAIKKAMELAEGLPEMADRVEALKAQIEENKKYWAQVEAEREAERKEREAARAKARKMRFVEDSREATGMVGKVVEYAGGLVFVTGLGREFRFDSENNGNQYCWRPDLDGEMVCYCYYREATEDEISAYKAAKAVKHAAKKAAATETPVTTATATPADNHPDAIPSDKLREDRKARVIKAGLYRYTYEEGWCAAIIVAEYKRPPLSAPEKKRGEAVDWVTYYLRPCTPQECQMLKERLSEYETLMRTSYKERRSGNLERFNALQAQAEPIAEALARDHIVFE